MWSLRCIIWPDSTWMYRLESTHTHFFLVYHWPLWSHESWSNQIYSCWCGGILFSLVLCTNSICKSCIVSTVRLTLTSMLCCSSVQTDLRFFCINSCNDTKAMHAKLLSLQSKNSATKESRHSLNYVPTKILCPRFDLSAIFFISLILLGFRLLIASLIWPSYAIVDWWSNLLWVWPPRKSCI